MTDEPLIKQGAFSTGATREALRRLRKQRKGALLVTSGHRDLRLVVSPRQLSVEGVGTELVGNGEADLVRSFLCCLFWDDPTYLLDLEGEAKKGVPAIRIQGSLYQIIESIETGISELGALREQVPGLDLTVSVSGDPPPEEANGPAAALFRVLKDRPTGGHLGGSADQAGLDEVDAAWAVVDLLELGQVVVKRPPPTMAIRRLKHAEPLAGEGIIPAVRYNHLARGYQRSDPKKAAHYLQEAGDSFLTHKMPEQALEAFSTSLETMPDSVSGLEGVVRTLQLLKRGGDAKQVRRKLVQTYKSWSMPKRTLKHLEAIPDTTAEEKELQLDCLLRTQDFPGALEFAKRILAKADAETRVATVKRFAESGADAKTLNAVKALAKLQALKPVKRLLHLVAFVGLLASGVLGAEVFFLRPKFDQARSATRVDMDADRFAGLLDHWKELEGIRGQLGGAADLPFTCLASLPQIRADIEGLQVDHAALSAPGGRDPFNWRAYDDVRQAETGLAKLAKAAKSDALKAEVTKTQGEITAYLSAVQEKVTKFTNTSDLAKAFTMGRELLDAHRNARHLFQDKDLILSLTVRPAYEATDARWRGKLLKVESTSSTGTAELRLPLRPASSGKLVITLKDHVPVTRELVLETLRSHKLSLELIPYRKLDRQGELQKPTDLTAQEEGEGFAVRDAKEWYREKTSPVEPTVPPSAEHLKSLKAVLDPGQVVTIQVLNLWKASGGPRPPRVYFTGFRVWLHDLSGNKTRGRRIDLKGPILPGIRRKVSREGDGWLMEGIQQCDGFEQVLSALRYVIEKVLKPELTNQ